MIKKCCWTVLMMFTLVCLPGLSSHLDGKSLGVGLNARYLSFPDDIYSESISYSLKLFYTVGKNFRLELSGGFMETNLETSVDPGTLDDGNFKLIPLQLSLQYQLKFGKFRPYLGAGIGYHLNNFSPAAESLWNSFGFNVKEDVDIALGYHLGAGLDYAISSAFAFNLDFRYNMASYTGTYQITDEVVGFSMSGDIAGDLKYMTIGTGFSIMF